MSRILGVIQTLLYGKDTPGYASIMIALLFLGGIQLIGIGVLGEYIGRIYDEVKLRPIYIVSRKYDANTVTGNSERPQNEGLKNFA